MIWKTNSGFQHIFVAFPRQNILRISEKYLVFLCAIWKISCNLSFDLLTTYMNHWRTDQTTKFTFILLRVDMMANIPLSSLLLTGKYYLKFLYLYQFKNNLKGFQVSYRWTKMGQLGIRKAPSKMYMRTRIRWTIKERVKDRNSLKTSKKR